MMIKKNSFIFKAFLREFNKEGKERGEGFSRRTLSILFGKDYNKAEELLIETIEEIRSVNALGFIKSKKAIPLLIQKYNESNGSYKIAISYALHQLSVFTDKEYIDILTQFLQDPDKHVKIDALAYLAEINNDDIINILINLINNETDRNVISFAFDILFEDIFGLYSFESFFRSKYRPFFLRLVSKDDEIHAKALQEFNVIVSACKKKRNRWKWLRFK